MNNINKLIHRKNWSIIVPVIKDTIIRFPLPIILLLLASVIALLQLHDVVSFGREALTRYLAILWYGVLALTSLKLYSENKQLNVPRQIIATVIIMLAIAYYVLSYFDVYNLISSILFLLALLSSLSFSPYIKTDSTSDSVWYFNYQTGVAVFFASVAAIILGGGISLSLISLAYLFEIKVPSKAYADVWLLCWSILFPVYILANIAKTFDYDEESCGFPKGVSFITNYILAPLMLAYMAILYVYFFKIILQWELPRGNLAWMIIAFGFIGITTKLLAYPIRNSGTRLLTVFDRYYYYALVVPILLLFIAITVRIHDYGLSERRYAVVLLGLWFAIITIIAILKKNRFHIKTVPITLVVLALFSSYGPWSTAELSLKSQMSRFETLLQKYKLLNNGQVIRSEGEISFDERKVMSSIADYLTENEFRLMRITPMFTSLLEASGNKHLTSKKYRGGTRLLGLMGVTYVDKWKTKNVATTQFNYIRQYNTKKIMTDINDFDFIGMGKTYFHKKEATELFKIINKHRETYIPVTVRNGKFTVSYNGLDKVEFDLFNLVKNVQKQFITTIDQDSMNEFTLDRQSKNGQLRVRLIIDVIKGNSYSDGRIDISNLEYTLLIKIAE